MLVTDQMRPDLIKACSSTRWLLVTRIGPAEGLGSGTCILCQQPLRLRHKRHKASTLRVLPPLLLSQFS